MGVFFVDFFLVLISVARFFAELERVCGKVKSEVEILILKIINPDFKKFAKESKSSR